jgi:hypothetical protein
MILRILKNNEASRLSVLSEQPTVRTSSRLVGVNVPALNIPAVRL